MQTGEPFVDVHCHLLPSLDDGAESWAESLEMARIAAADGITTVVATPHQLGAFGHIHGDRVRQATAELQRYLERHGVSLTVLPGADVRVEPDLVRYLRSGDVLTLGDHGKHVLLELPHETYVPLDTCLERLARVSITPILSHPERNQGLLRRPQLMAQLAERGCLMQITADSLLGMFGPRCRALSEQAVQQGWTHLVATDAHGSKARRPLMQRAFGRIVELAGPLVAYTLCCRNPALVARGYDVVPHKPPRSRSRTSWLAALMPRRSAA